MGHILLSAAMGITQECCLLLILSYFQPLTAAPPHQALVRALPEVWRVNLPNLSSSTWSLPSGAATRQWSGRPNYKLEIPPMVHPGKKQPIDKSVSFDNSKMSSELKNDPRIIPPASPRLWCFKCLIK